MTARLLPFVALVGALVAAALLAAAVGALPVPPLQLVGAFLERLGFASPWPLDDTQRTILWTLRIPRILLAAGVGAALALAGATLQGLFRNPLVDPGLLGVSSGAALGVAAVLVFGAAAFPLGASVLLPLAAFAGGVAATAFVFRLARRDGRTDVAVLLLAGVAVNAVAGAALAALSYVADDAQLRQITFWLFGSFGGANPAALLGTGLALAIAVAILFSLAPRLDVLLLGEPEARQLGVPVERTKMLAIGASTLAVGAAVAASGIVGFIGLLCPHVARLLLGPGHARLLPASALLGATLAVLADAVARTALAPAELPVGILTALVGAPGFLALLLARRTGVNA